jgi:hypothetical protein
MLCRTSLRLTCLQTPCNVPLEIDSFIIDGLLGYFDTAHGTLTPLRGFSVRAMSIFANVINP